MARYSLSLSALLLIGALCGVIFIPVSCKVSARILATFIAVPVLGTASTRTSKLSKPASCAVCTARAADFDCALYESTCVATSLSSAYADCTATVTANPGDVSDSRPTCNLLAFGHSVQLSVWLNRGMVWCSMR
eukprot:1036538-Prorocentrum_minimum.AAC.1